MVQSTGLKSTAKQKGILQGTDVPVVHPDKYNIQSNMTVSDETVFFNAFKAERRRHELNKRIQR